MMILARKLTVQFHNINVLCSRTSDIIYKLPLTISVETHGNSSVVCESFSNISVDIY